MSTCRLALPSAIGYPSGTPTFNNQALSSAAHRIAFAFIAQDTAVINALGLRLATITGASPTYQIDIQELDAAGLPNGTTIIGSSATFNPSSLGWTAGSFQWLTIAGVTLTRGFPYAIVVRHASETIDANNHASFSTHQTSVSPSLFGLPYPLTDTGTGWTKITSHGDPTFGYRSSTNTYGSPIQSWINGSITTNGHRAALKCTLNSGWGSTFRIRGLMIHWISATGGGTFKLGAWNAAGAEVAAATLDSDHLSSTTTRCIRASLSSAPTFSFGTPYYFGIERVATTTLAPRYIEVGNNRDLEAYPFGSAATLSTWNGSTWTDTPTQLLPLTLLLDDWSTPASNGSIIMG